MGEWTSIASTLRKKRKIELIPTSFFRKMELWPLFHLFLVFPNKQYNSYNKSMWKNVKSIQYIALGFEPTTSQTWVVSHNQPYTNILYFKMSMDEVKQYIKAKWIGKLFWSIECAEEMRWDAIFSKSKLLQQIG